MGAGVAIARYFAPGNEMGFGFIGALIPLVTLPLLLKRLLEI